MNLILFFAIRAAALAQQSAPIATQLSDLVANQPFYPACTMPSTLVLAEYQVWYGLPSHKGTPPYISTDPNVIARHIQAAQAQCIRGFVLDWYGTPTGLVTNADRQFEDDAATEILRQANTIGFNVALMYDEGTLRDVASPELYTTRVISDLRYAERHLLQPSYLKWHDQPLLFVFPYEAIDSYIDWNAVRQRLDFPVVLIDKDPDPTAAAHDARFDGFYSWVQASTSQWLPNDWGGMYLKWFYRTMATSAYANKLTIGGVWPGFNDKRNVRSTERYMARRCGQTWIDTWNLVKAYHPPIVLISTWNDFTEDTDIEDGILKLAANNNSPTFANQFTALNANLSDCGDVTYTWNFGDNTTGSGANVSHVYTETGTYTVFVTAATVTTTLSTTTVVSIKSDVIGWQEDFDPLTFSLWQQISANWLDLPGPSAKLCETNPADLSGKVESEPINLDIDRFPLLRVATSAVDGDARYTVQILDKTTNTATNVLTDVPVPSTQEVNLAQQLQWNGTKSFTINLWIVGEGKCAVFDLVQLENPTPSPVTLTWTHLYLPFIGR
ncbi:MAG: endo-1,3-alpha-glucanase family glycosylhydrolase [Caldilineaceae bacterium]